MKKYKSEINNIESIISKLGLADNAAEQTKRHIANRKRFVYKNILKKLGVYTLLSGVYIYLYFLIKKFLVTLSVKSVLIAAVCTSTLSVSGYYIVRQMHGQNVKKSATDVIEVKPEVKNDESAVKPVKIVYRFGVRRFDSSNINSAQKGLAEKILLSKLRSGKGDNYAALATDDLSYLYSIRGSVELIDGKFIVMVKVTELSSSSIVFSGKEIADGENGIEAACGLLSEKIINVVK